MNREDEPRTDPIDEREPAEVAQRLDAIERRLQSVRPRPTRLDAAALELLALESDRVRPADTRRRLYWRMTVVASTWVCGAMVGAAVMFVIMHRPATAIDTTAIDTSPIDTKAVDASAIELSKETDETENERPEAETPSEQHEEPPAPVENFDPYGRDAAMMALAFDRFGFENSPYWDDERPLRAGMYLLRHCGDPSQPNLTMAAVRQPRVEKKPERTLKRDYVPSPPVTREQLLKEFLDPSTGSFL